MIEMVIAPLVPIAGTGARIGLGALLRKYRKRIPAGLGATLKYVISHAEELEDAGLCPWCEGGHDTGPSTMSTSPRRSRSTRTLRMPAKKKRKVSAYQREFGRQLKKLKRAHPRTPVTKLMKRAHSATKRVRRGK